MKAFFVKHPYWLVCAIAILCASGYWSLWATDRYVSQATIVVQSARGAPISTFSISSLLTGGGAHQLLVLREYLLSTDMLKKLDAALDLRSHYSSDAIDFFSRLASPDVPMERFHEYYLERVSVTLDEYANVLRIEAQAYDAQTAHAIVTMLLHAGEVHLNKMSQQLAEAQIEFIKDQVEELKQRVKHAKEALLAYRNAHELISPTGAVESLSTVVATLQGKLAKLSAHRRALGMTHSPSSPAMLEVSREINALKAQIKDLRSRMASSSAGAALNRLSAKYETLKLRLEFARKMYTSALAALESTRVQAASSLKQVAVLQSPTMPEYPMAPRRLHNIIVFTILAVVGTLIVHLLMAIVRDHRD